VKIFVLFFVALALLGAFAAAQSVQEMPVLSSCNVTVYADGTTIVSQRWYVFSNQSYLALNGSEASSIILVYGLNGTQPVAPLPYNYSKGGIFVNSQGFLKVGVTFSSELMTYKRGSIWTIYWNYATPVLVELPKGAILLGWSKNPVQLYTINESVFALMPSGYGYLNYTVAQEPGYVLGSVFPPSNILVNGKIVLNGSSFNLTLIPGIYNLSFKAPGYQQFSESVIVQPGVVQILKSITLKLYLRSIQLFLSSSSVEKGERVTLVAKGFSSSGAPAPDQKLTFLVNGSAIGESATNSSGVATLGFTPPKAGIFLIKAVSSINSSLSSQPDELTVLQPTNYAPYVAVVFLVVAGFAAGLVLARHRREKKISGQDLDPEEKMILGYIKAHNGKAFQSELLSALPIPKTTLWRNVMSLQEKGYVRVTKIGGQNLVTAVNRSLFETSSKNLSKYLKGTLAPLACLCPPPLPIAARAASLAISPRSTSELFERLSDIWYSPTSSLYAIATSISIV